ncbi:hypothetical protein EB59_00524, partial [Enterococcus faecium]
MYGFFHLHKIFYTLSYLLEPHIIITHEQTKTFNKIKDLTLEWKKIYPIET